MSRPKSQKLPVPSEAQVVKTCLAILGGRGILAWRNNTGSFVGEYKGKRRFVRFGIRGASDIFSVLPSGRFMTVEVKRPGKHPNREQIAFMWAVNDIGGVAFWVSNGSQLESVLDHVLGGGSVRVNEAGDVFAEGA